MAHHLSSRFMKVRQRRELKQTFILLIVLIALVINILAPILALYWAKLPFPGVLTSHTLVVANIYHPTWPVRQKMPDGLSILQAVNDSPISNSQDLAQRAIVYLSRLVSQIAIPFWGRGYPTPSTPNPFLPTHSYHTALYN